MLNAEHLVTVWANEVSIGKRRRRPLGVSAVDDRFSHATPSGHGTSISTVPAWNVMHVEVSSSAMFPLSLRALTTAANISAQFSSLMVLGLTSSFMVRTSFMSSITTWLLPIIILTW